MTNLQNNFAKELVGQKALKLATALYMVTDIMSEKEPLKWHLRERAVSLLEATDKNIMSVIEETLAILTIARIARAVSPMNAQVLEAEYKTLGETLKGELRGNEEAIFTPEFFAVEPPALAAPAATASNILAPVTQVVAKSPEVKPVIKSEVSPSMKATAAPKEVLAVKGSAEAVETPIPSTYMEDQKDNGADAEVVSDHIPELRTARDAKVAVERNKRRDAIIRLMYEKGECNVKDISFVLKDVSDKTVQRELAAMMEEGIIAREGDRRWAMYHLA